MDTRSYHIRFRLRKRAFSVEDADDAYVMTLLSTAAPNTFFVTTRTTKPGVDGYEAFARLENANSLTRPTKLLPKRIRSLRPSLATSVTSLGVNVIWFSSSSNGSEPEVLIRDDSSGVRFRDGTPSLDEHRL